ncbi:MAG: phage GP46 family protein [Brucella anthropi]
MTQKPAALIWRSARMAISLLMKPRSRRSFFLSALIAVPIPDDPLPEGRSQFLTGSGIDVRRGAAADALDPYGERIGSRCWLLDRAKETETTRLLYQSWLAESLEWVTSDTGIPAEIETEWVAPQMLGWRVLVDDTAISGRRTAA